MALFLLPENLNRLAPKFLELKPGTRIVANAFGIDGWEPDVTERADGDCGSWCTALLYIVPAKVAGIWRLPQGELELQQNFQKVTGTLSLAGKSRPITDGRVQGDVITFIAGDARYEGRVNGDAMRGIGRSWAARRIQPAAAAASKQ